MQTIIRLSIYLFTGFILWIIYLANTGQPSLFFELVKILPLGDKLGHFFLFGILTLGTNILSNYKKLKIGTATFHAGTLGVTVFVVIEEISQIFLPTRTFDMHDFVANLLGILVFTIITYQLDSKQKSDR